MKVSRQELVLRSDLTRVLLRPFELSDDQQAMRVVARALMQPEKRVKELLRGILKDFAHRHRDIKAFFMQRFEEVKHLIPTDKEISEERALLVGSYFTKEYSTESAALFNPSIVPAPDQSGLPDGSLRFVLALRGTGDGHISSIAFRSGVVDAEGSVSIEESARYVTDGEHAPNQSFTKAMFERKLYEIDLDNGFSRRVLTMLGDTFSLGELHACLQFHKKRMGGRDDDCVRTMRGMLILAESNYELKFPPDTDIAERIVFPASPTQSNGIEDARFVLFESDDGSHIYYATYTAFDGRLIVPQLLETQDFLRFKFITLNGPAVQNKGMGLFPRKINGQYAMLSRQDNENIYVMYSDNIHFWYSPEIVAKPTHSWESVQLGNCGSPIETHAGWLVLSHGVGPMRRYCMGAFLLDKDSPSKLLGRLTEPLIAPNEDEREGYVPNVVYTCGALLYGKKLIIPYAASDHETRFATVALDDILRAMR